MTLVKPGGALLAFLTPPETEEALRFAAVLQTTVGGEAPVTLIADVLTLPDELTGTDAERAAPVAPPLIMQNEATVAEILTSCWAACAKACVTANMEIAVAAAMLSTFFIRTLIY